MEVNSIISVEKSVLLRKIFLMVKKTAIIVVGITVLAAIGLLIVFFDDVSPVVFGQYQMPRDEIFTVILTSVGVIAVIVALYYAAKYLPKLKKYNAGVRFNNAVGHLGSVSPTVVLGGIHDLHQIAINNNDYTMLVHNLFCSYIRENSTQLYSNIENESGKCPVVLQQLVDYLFKPYNGKTVYKKFLTDLSYSTLINCDFMETGITDVNFSNCDIRKCSFNRAVLRRVIFNDSILSDLDFNHASFHDVDFYGAVFRDVSFLKAAISDVDFWETTLCNVGYGNTLLNNVDFLKATMNKVDFGDTTFNGAYFDEAMMDDFTIDNLKINKIIKLLEP